MEEHYVQFSGEDNISSSIHLHVWLLFWDQFRRVIASYHSELEPFLQPTSLWIMNPHPWLELSSHLTACAELGLSSVFPDSCSCCRLGWGLVGLAASDSCFGATAPRKFLLLGAGVSTNRLLPVGADVQMICGTPALVEWDWVLGSVDWAAAPWAHGIDVVVAQTLLRRAGICIHGQLHQQVFVSQGFAFRVISCAAMLLPISSSVCQYVKYIIPCVKLWKELACAQMHVEYPNAVGYHSGGTASGGRGESSSPWGKLFDVSPGPSTGAEATRWAAWAAPQLSISWCFPSSHQVKDVLQLKCGMRGGRAMPLLCPCPKKCSCQNRCLTGKQPTCLQPADHPLRRVAAGQGCVVIPKAPSVFQELFLILMFTSPWLPCLAN